MNAIRKPIVERAWCAIPAYNNGGTARDVALACRRELPHVVVVDDGSTDADLAALLADTDIVVLRHERNQGKGKAILTALRYVAERGGEFMITLDADGQHDPADIRQFLPILNDSPTAVVIGARRMEEGGAPRVSRVGMRVSDFWLDLETGLTLRDTQSGFRAYPVRYLSKIRFAGSRYEFEVEVLARAAWAGLPVRIVDVAVKYREGPGWISHFHAFRDNLRISLMHARLVGRRLLPWPNQRLVRRKPEWRRELFRHPSRFARRMLKEHHTPAELGFAAALGVLIGALPWVPIIPFPFHTAIILYLATRLNVNRLLAYAAQNLCMPPFVPLACMELGYFMRKGQWITEEKWRQWFPDLSLGGVARELWQHAPGRLYDWLLGSLILGPVLAVLTGFLVAGLAASFRWRWQAHQPISKPKSQISSGEPW